MPLGSDSKTVVIIPARLNSTRLPEKLIQPIYGKPVLYWTWLKASKVFKDNIYIASPNNVIKDQMSAYNIPVLMVPDTLQSGSDAVYWAWKHYLQDYSIIINLQGDMPTVKKESLEKIIEPTEKFGVGTLATVFTKKEAIDPNKVKIVLAKEKRGDLYKALYFSRALVPYNRDNENNDNTKFYHHIGIYGYKKENLEKFANLPPSLLEETEKLEQLRLLENNIPIGVKLTDDPECFGIDTIADLIKFRENFFTYFNKEDV